MTMSSPRQHVGEQRDLLVHRLAGLHHDDDRARRTDGRRKLGDRLAGHDRRCRLPAASMECAGSRRGPVEHRDAIALFRDVEGEVGAHHAKPDQSDFGIRHAPALVDWSIAAVFSQARGRC